MQKPIYVHYGSTFFEPSGYFPFCGHCSLGQAFWWTMGVSPGCDFWMEGLVRAGGV